MKQIKLSKGLFALVDSDIFEHLNSMKWTASSESGGKKWYAIRTVKGKKIRMHRYILELKGIEIRKGFVVDHVNHNSLDNRLFNLEIVTQRENMLRSPGWKRKNEN
jgi:hypothetical protein